MFVDAQASGAGETVLVMNLLRRLANNEEAGSLAAGWRQKRFALFRSLLSRLSPPVGVLDVGGTELFWERMGFAEEGVSVLLLNVEKAETSRPNFVSVSGDARDMREFRDGQFDVVFSNSVIEHVGGPAEQRRMAEEVKRVGKRYFLQTPNRFFPVEPHFLFPLFQFLPLSARTFLVRRFDLGFYGRGRISKEEAREIVSSIRLLTEKELRSLFPGGTLYKEKFLGLNKSFIVYGGWEDVQTAPD
jgi:Methyltransferase domain